MLRKKVISSHIASIGYEGLSSILEIEFLDSSIYRYFGVPISIYEGIMVAISPGKYLERNIKDQYRYTKIL